MFRLGTKQISEVSHSEVSFKKISVFFMDRRSEIVLFGSYFNPAKRIATKHKQVLI